MAGGTSRTRSASSTAMPGMARLREKKTALPLRGSAVVTASMLVTMLSAARPRRRSVWAETVLTVSSSSGGLRPPAVRVMAGMPAATRGAWLPPPIGAARRSDWVTKFGSGVRSFASALPAALASAQIHGGATRALALQPLTTIESALARPTWSRAMAARMPRSPWRAMKSRLPREP